MSRHQAKRQLRLSTRRKLHFRLVRSCVFPVWPSAGLLLPKYSPDHGSLPGGHALVSRPNGWGALGSAAYLVVSEWMLPLLPRAGARTRRLCGDGGAAAWGWFVSRRARFPVWSTEARGSPGVLAEGAVVCSCNGGGGSCSTS